MRCPLCDMPVTHDIPARHLPHFFRCPACTGYVHRAAEMPAYPEAYFAESTAPTGFARFLAPLLRGFLAFRARTVRRALRGAAGGQVLDYGCGNGKLVAYLKTHGVNAEGFDPSPGAVSLAQKKGLPVFGALSRKRYDLIMFWHSLEHTDTPLKDLRRLKRFLAERGRVLIAVPNGDALEAIVARAKWFCYDWPYHRVHFTSRSIAHMLAAAGFRIVRVDHLNPEYTVSSLAQTFLNMFLPKNVLYAAAAHRRQEGSARRTALLCASLLFLLVFSPVLCILFFAGLAMRRTAAMIVTAERMPVGFSRESVAPVAGRIAGALGMILLVAAVLSQTIFSARHPLVSVTVVCAVAGAGWMLNRWLHGASQSVERPPEGGFADGMRSVGFAISGIVNTCLLLIAYIVGVGVSSVIGRAIGKQFLDVSTDPGRASFWEDLRRPGGARTKDAYTRQF